MEIGSINESFGSYHGDRYAQLSQDVLALAVTGQKHQGYFVEFGVMDGKFASNTYLLEKEYQWTGILAEPAQRFHSAIAGNRSCHVDHRAVADRTGQQLRFQEMSTDEGMSGLVDFFDSREIHYHRRGQTPSKFYDVETVSLADLLDCYHAPDHIDYISMDTEGSEPAILESFDFSRRVIDLWTIEHNYLESARNRIRDVMQHNGYTQIMEQYSQYDDWYIRTEILQTRT
jgi:FkbM family methyltransferase